MSNVDLRFRQIHLDFHTSPDIEGIGDEFDAEEFASTLEKAHVDSITCFARCHHGMLYYDSKAFPERVHPHLANKNLLKQQIEACHRHNIRVPIYITVQWDQYTSEEHPEWLAVDGEGKPFGNALFEPGFYRKLCVNSPYRDFLKAFTQEILETFPVDGLFFDIVQPTPCVCKYCRAEMEALNLDPSSLEDRQKYGQMMINEFKRDMTAFIRQFNKKCTIFYNKGHVGPAHRPVTDAYTHFELESLPSGGWGYLHFPIAVRYARNLGLDCMGMTGKFHTSWGDFHSFKNKAALEFECFHMLALNAKCSIGDQLEPNGRLSQPVYDLIGSVYSQVEAKEPWCVGAKAVTDIGVFTPEEFEGANDIRLTPSIMGVTRMLQEAGHQFDIIDSQAELSKYKVLVLPDIIPVSDEFASKLEKYIANGGAIIASFESGLNENKDAFNLRPLGVKLKGQAPYSPDFIILRGDIGKGLPQTEHVMYMRGLEVEATEGTEVLAETAIPYFNRTWQHFCSHRHTPSSGSIGYPGILKNGRAIYFMHPIFAQYEQNAPRWCKQLFLNALDILLPEPAVRHSGPSTMIVALNEQAEHNRLVLHLLHYIPERRSSDIDIIEDVIPLYNVKVSVKVNGDVKVVTCVPQGQSMAFEVKDGRVEFTVPEINGHQMVALQMV
ncbi:beta-galactosidase trimerization domain-containing protein [Mahella australiensis]|uniref:Beta-galactosidase trimerisation domain protein n=1 Tax=Mahella australiensis (strain DSM 15567 / CIP 107919 / 50-1 BON) TaxID=697281 RepID=F3ZVQ2_MAHA5|nr:beta-galactosidase trimerization domain-containing protein [Mahella australiensis]AEE97446.1 Beta-galactosidase trimerisation domain protein [Mahella australiensis 50-1 BON]